jgi:dipeptidyl aminopeptidase/acylaminoacyl peptidase
MLANLAGGRKIYYAHQLRSIDEQLAWTENVDGYSKLFIRNLRNEETTEVQNGLFNNNNSGVIEDVKLSAPDGKKFGIIITTPVSPSDMYLIDSDGDGNINDYKAVRISHSLIGNIPQNVMVKPELIKYNSFDGLEISAYLYKPNTADSGRDKDTKWGAILSIYGGLTAQERPLYDYAGFYQYLANNGIAIMVPVFWAVQDAAKASRK